MSVHELYRQALTGNVPTRGESQEQFEEMMWGQVAITCASVQSMEREWDPEKFGKKMAEYLKKAGKNAGGGPTVTWNQVVESAATKFYELMASACFDRPWLDHADFALPLSSAIKAYCTNPALFADIPADEYLAKVSQCATLAHDTARYYAAAWEPLKEIVPNKVAVKKVREALDTAREAVVKLMPPNADIFLQNWVLRTLELLAASSFRNNPKASLLEADALLLFDAMIAKGCGLPMWLESLNGGKPPPGCAAVANAVALSYAPHEDLRPRPKGESKSAAAWGAPGSTAWGMDPQSIAMMQYNQVYGMGKGGGKGKYSPY